MRWHLPCCSMSTYSISASTRSWNSASSSRRATASTTAATTWPPSSTKCSSWLSWLSSKVSDFYLDSNTNRWIEKANQNRTKKKNLLQCILLQTLDFIFIWIRSIFVYIFRNRFTIEAKEALNWKVASLKTLCLNSKLSVTKRYSKLFPHLFVGLKKLLWVGHFTEIC